jgi:hypothetical protein
MIADKPEDVSTISWTTGTQTEALSVNSAVSSAFTGTSAAAVQMPTGAGYCPANFWLPSYGIGKALLVKAFGVLSTTTGSNSLTLGVIADTTEGTIAPANLTSGTAGVLATTGAITQTASLSNVPWDLEVLITCVTTGSSATFLSDGIMRVYPTTSTLLASRCSSSTANPNTTVTIGTSGTTGAYYVELGALWSAGSNSITVYGYTVFGLN